MNSELPTNLTFEGSSLTISFEKEAKLNSTKSTIVIQGTRAGFLSLTNAIFFYLNDLSDVIEFNKLPYITSSINLTIEPDESLEGLSYGTINQSTDQQFVWRMSEAEICRVASEVHSLGYVNNELHLDEAKKPGEISVYCVVS